MNVLLSTIGRRGYLVDYFHDLEPAVVVHGTTDRHDVQRGFSPGLLVCDRRHTLPPIASSSYPAAVIDLCQQESIHLITSLFDDDCERLSHHIGALINAGTFPVISSPRVNQICHDKLGTQEFLQSHGFPTVPTWPSVAACLSDGTTAPLFVKPRYGFASRQSFRVDAPETLAAQRPPPEPMVVQQFLDYPEYGMDLFCQDGRVVSCVIRRKISMRAGETDQAITVRDHRLLEFGVRLGEALAPTGPLDVDFFLTPEGPVVIDLNPRLGGGYPLTHAAGGNYPELMVRMARGETLPSSLGRYDEGLVLIKDIRPRVTPLQELDRMSDRAPPPGHL